MLKFQTKKMNSIESVFFALSLFTMKISILTFLLFKLFKHEFGIKLKKKRFYDLTTTKKTVIIFYTPKSIDKWENSI